MSDRELPEAIGKAAAGQFDRTAASRLARLAVSSMRRAGAGAVATGRWLADTAIAAAPHIPIRDRTTLEEHYEGLAGADLAGELIRNAARTTAAIGATTGALAGAEELSPPTWLALPVELVVETLAVAAVEMKLVAELHEVYGRPVPGRGSDRGLALARAWAERRGVTAETLVRGQGVGDLLGRGARQ